MSETWHSVVAQSELPREGKLATKVAGWWVLLFHGEDGIHAINDRCTHQAALLSTGRVRRGAVMCPLHGARFELATGRCVGGTYPELRVFPVRVVDDMIEVAVPDSPPGMDEIPIGA